jgi:hypothetical protein
MYIGMIQSKIDAPKEMKSIIYVISPLPIIDTMTTICRSMIQQSDFTSPTNFEIPLTQFQHETMKMNLETIKYTLETPYHRERVVEFYVNPPGVC